MRMEHLLLGPHTRNVTSPQVPDAFATTCVAALVVESTHVAMGFGW